MMLRFASKQKLQKQAYHPKQKTQHHYVLLVVIPIIYATGMHRMIAMSRSYTDHDMLPVRATMGNLAYSTHNVGFNGLEVECR